jgi:NAD(P)-dependent dehydrogenase (short-subunit alcohol dehydrogenase family)
MTENDKPLEGRVVLVTGASRGIGYYTALEAARQGAHVIALARTVGGLEELDDDIRAADGQPATLVPLDVSDFDAIDRLGASIDERWKRLDGFVGNAGILGGLSPLGHYEPKNFERVFDINVIANWRFIRSLDPLLRASDAGRAVFVTSGAAHSCKPYWGPYAASKAALEALAQVYAAECQNTSIRVNIFDPNVARTAMRALAMPGENKWSLPDPSLPASHLVKLLLPEVTKNGKIYSVEKNKFLTSRRPA